jgi:flagellar hook-associated protein 2
MSNSVNLAALGFGGLDTSTLVSSLVAIEQEPITQLQQEQANVQSASSTISNFSNDLSALANAATALSDPTTFQAMSATSSDPSIVATASGNPAAGQWSVSVQSIAQEQRTLSNGTASADTALGLSGTLAVTMGNGQTANIAVSSTDTLQDVANAISSAGLPIQASVMYDGSQYHLLVSGTSTGASNSITYNESGLTNTGYSLGLSTAKNTIQSATDAQLTVGGVPVTSATNQVTNAIPGVTLAVTQPTANAATVTIAGDSTAVQQQVQAFVNAYNQVIGDGHSDAGYGKTAAANTLLQGDQGIESTLDQIGQLVGEQVPGTSGAYTTLASVGITLNEDGTLSFNTGTFQAAMQADPSGVQRMFVTDASNGSTGIMSQFSNVINMLTDPSSGVLTAEAQGFNSRGTAIGQQITDGQQRVTQYQTQLQTEFSQMNAMLAQYKQMAQSLNESFNSNSNSSSNSVL